MAPSIWGKATSSKDDGVQSHQSKEQIRSGVTPSQSWRGRGTIHKPDVSTRTVCLYLSLGRATDTHPLNIGWSKWAIMMLSTTVPRPRIGSGTESRAQQGLQPSHWQEEALMGTGTSWGLARDCAHSVTKEALVLCCGRRLLQKMRQLWTKACLGNRTGIIGAVAKICTKKKTKPNLAVWYK